MREWSPDEFKTQVSLLFDELNEVSIDAKCERIAIWLDSRKD